MDVSGGVRIPKKEPELIPAQPEPVASGPVVELSFWEKHGFKRLLGALLTTAGGVLSVAYPPAAAIGEGLAMIGALLFGVGAADWAYKKYEGVDMTDNVIRALLELLARIIELFKKKKGS